jgi:hypothetical protein
MVGGQIVAIIILTPNSGIMARIVRGFDSIFVASQNAVKRDLIDTEPTVESGVDEHILFAVVDASLANIL